MSIKNRYFKTTQGIPYELVIADTVLTGAGTSLNSFKTTGTLYKMGIFKDEAASSGPVSLATNTAIPTADRKKDVIFGYVVENDANGVAIVRLTTPLVANTIKVETVSYKAAAKQVSVLANAGVGVVSTNQILQVKIIETTPGYQPLPTWDYVQPLTLGQTSAFNAIVSKIALQKEDEFFTAAYNLGTYSAPTVGTVTISGGITAINFTAGANIYLQQYAPTGNGQIPITLTGGTGSGGAAYLPIVNGVAQTPVITAAGSYTGAPTASLPTLTTITGYNTGLIVASNDATRTFKIVASILPTKADPSDTGVYYIFSTSVTPYAGTGLLEQVKELQIEDNIRRGITHYYTNLISGGVTANDFGLPTSAIGTSTTFDLVIVSGVRREASPTPLEEHKNLKYILIAVPSGSTAATIAAMFAF